MNLYAGHIKFIVEAMKEANLPQQAKVYLLIYFADLDRSECPLSFS